LKQFHISVPYKIMALSAILALVQCHNSEILRDSLFEGVATRNFLFILLLLFTQIFSVRNPLLYACYTTSWQYGENIHAQRKVFHFTSQNVPYFLYNSIKNHKLTHFL
jgi:hypothetical protein